MSVLLSGRRLSYAAGTKQLIQDISFTVEKGDKIGLNGHNGCGKSTLLKLLAGEIQPDDGEISLRQGLRIAMVEQFLPEAVARLDMLSAVSEQIPQAERLTEGYRAELMLMVLGFKEDQFELAVGDLSGGQLNRLMLARALVGEPDLILFDEPSNHMDLATLALLEEYLTEQIPCAFVLVSHDRALLDGVTNKTLILRDQRLYHFNLPYSAARRDLTEMDIAAAASRAEEEKKITALRASAKRLALWGKVYDNEKLARKAKNMEKRVARMEQARTFVSRGSGLALSLDSRNTRANRVLRLADLSVHPVGAEHVRLFHIDELIIRPGDRIALLGPNGCGKTTLLKILIDHSRGSLSGGPLDNHISFSPQADVGYYDQELQEVESGDKHESMVEFLRRTTSSIETTIRNSLINAGFAYLDHDRRVNVLSGGERARLMFLQLRLNRPNFLVMDEPTNHIDIDGKEELEEQLSTADATLLMTSHDRRFIDNLANRFLRIADGGLLEIQDPEEFYTASIQQEGSHRDSTAPYGRLADPELPVALPPAAETADAREGEMLERIIELEQKLQDDLARKPKYQKPKLQVQWREELAALNAQLENS